MLVSTLLVVAVAFRLAIVLDLRSRLDRVLAAGVVATAQVVGSLLVAGVVLRSLKPGAVLLVNLAIAALVFGVTLRGRRAHRWKGLRPARLWLAFRAHPWSGVLVALSCVVLGWRLLIAYVFPPYGWDALAYHLTAVGAWLQGAHIGGNDLHIYAQSFPMNGELVMAWIALMHTSDTWIDAAQIPFAILGGLAVAGFARLAEARGPAAAAGCALFVLTPIVQTQATSNYVDLYVAALFLIALYLFCRAVALSESEGRPWPVVYLSLSGCAAGLAVGGKPTGPILFVVLVAALVAGAIASRHRHGAGQVRVGQAALAFLVPCVVLAGFWYGRNLVEHSNPVYPAEVRILGRDVLAGPGILLSPAPGSSEPAAIVASWGHDFTRIFQSPPGRYDQPDETEGGMGLVWLFIGVPLLVPLVLRLHQRHSALLWTFLFPMGLLFVLQPYRWWSRFTIALLAPAFVALVVFIDKTPSRALRLAVQSLTLGLAGIGVWLGSSHVSGWNHDYGPREIVQLASKPAPDRTLGHLFLPSFRWVDGVGDRARIATAIPVVINRNQCPGGICQDLPFFYGIYGRRFSHSVFRLKSSSRQRTVAWLRRNRIGYAYVTRRSRFSRWLSDIPGVAVLYRDSHVIAFRLPNTSL